MILIKILENTIQIKTKNILTVFDDMNAGMFSNKKTLPSSNWTISPSPTKKDFCFLIRCMIHLLLS